MPLPPLVTPARPVIAEAAELPWERSHLSVPREDRALLAIPPLPDAAESAGENARLLDASDVAIQGRPLGRLRQEARREAVRLGRRFTRDVLGDVESDADPEKPLIIPGHQPALSHPGVWAKNFASANIARQLDGHVLNLIVDNDLHSNSAIDVPAGSRAAPTRRAIPFDQRQKSQPSETVRIQDADLFRTFGERVTEAMRQWRVDPLIHEHWNLAVRQFEAGRTLPECLTALRHGIETEWSHHQLELPMSRLCQSDPFLWAASHLLAHLPRFVGVYNEVLAEYRALYRIKSRNHPVPALETRGDWLEAPFWVWRDTAPHRRRVFAKTTGKQTVLADEAGETFAALPLNETMDACCAVEVLRSLPAQGIRFRTRALTTTLFARLFLADLFVHGVGGAKYDEMTDRIIARFWGIPAPAYATVSASLHLPFAHPFDVAAEDEQRLVELLRELDETPQRHLVAGDNPEVAELLAEKTRLIADQHAAEAHGNLTRKQRRGASSANRERFHRLRAVTARLADFTKDQKAAVRHELDDVRSKRRANGLLTNREFSFVLYPEPKIRGFMKAIDSSHLAPQDESSREA